MPVQSFSRKINPNDPSASMRRQTTRSQGIHISRRYRPGIGLRGARSQDLRVVEIDTPAARNQNGNPMPYANKRFLKWSHRK